MVSECSCYNICVTVGYHMWMNASANEGAISISLFLICNSALRMTELMLSLAGV